MSKASHVIIFTDGGCITHVEGCDSWSVVDYMILEDGLCPICQKKLTFGECLSCGVNYRSSNFNDHSDLDSDDVVLKAAKRYHHQD